MASRVFKYECCFALCWSQSRQEMVRSPVKEVFLAPPLLPAKAKRIKVKKKYAKYLGPGNFFPASFSPPVGTGWRKMYVGFVWGRTGLKRFLSSFSVLMYASGLIVSPRGIASTRITPPQSLKSVIIHLSVDREFFIFFFRGDSGWSASVASFTHPGFRPVGSLPEGQEHNFEL